MLNELENCNQSSGDVAQDSIKQAFRNSSFTDAKNVKNAFTSLHECGYHVEACLTPEPDNEKDCKAILIQRDYGQGFRSVGYIPGEMTKFLHPLLNSNCLISVAVKHLKFGTLAGITGYFMALDVTKQPWDKKVEKASKKVQ